MEYGSHFRMVVRILEKSHEVDLYEYFMNASVFRNEDNGDWHLIDIDGEMDEAHETIIDYLRDDRGEGYYEVFGELWVNYFQTWTDYGYEHDVDFEMRNETIIKLPKEIEKIFDENLIDKENNNGSI